MENNNHLKKGYYVAMTTTMIIMISYTKIEHLIIMKNVMIILHWKLIHLEDKANDTKQNNNKKP